MKSIDVTFHTGSLLADLARFMRRRKHAREQKTFCFCPGCHHDLCSNHSFISDTDLVRYACTNCGVRSEWNFDTPAPLLIRSTKI